MRLLDGSSQTFNSSMYIYSDFKLTIKPKLTGITVNDFNNYFLLHHEKSFLPTAPIIITQNRQSFRLQLSVSNSRHAIVSSPSNPFQVRYMCLSEQCRERRKRNFFLPNFSFSLFRSIILKQT